MIFFFKFNLMPHRYADDLLIPMKLTPDDIGWRKPSYFITDRQSHLDNRKKYINDLIEQVDKPSAYTYLCIMQQI